MECYDQDELIKLIKKILKLHEKQNKLIDELVKDLEKILDIKV